MKYSRFEDLPIWQEGRFLVGQIYGLIDSNKEFARDFSLVDQLKRAAFSVPLNIAEGFERGGNKEFANFINIAKGSAGEIRSILYIVLDRKYISLQSFEVLQKSLISISSSLSNFRKYLLEHQSYKKFSAH